MEEKYISQYTGLKIDEAIGLALLLNSLRGGANGLATLDANKKLAQMPDASDVGAVPTERTVNGKPLSANIMLNATDVGALPSTEKGQPNGIATLDGTGKLTTSQFPIMENVRLYRQNDNGEEYRADFAVGKSGNIMSGYVGLFSPDGDMLNSLQVAEDGLKVSGPAYLKKVTFPFGTEGILYGTKKDGTEFSVLEPSISGNFTVLGRGNLNEAGGGTGEGATTYVMGHSIMFRISDSNVGIQNWKPYYNGGQSFTIGIDTAGFVSSNPKYVYFTIPLYKPVVGGPTITAATGDGMIVRCNGKFAYGSSDSNKIRPASYVVSRTTTCIRIRAEFGNTTNATANTAIGVYWHGTITFS